MFHPTDLRYFTDASFLKLFGLAQLTLEYLINVQDYLLQREARRRDQIGSLRQRLARANAEVARSGDELRATQRDLRHVRRVAQTFERMMAGAAPPATLPTRPDGGSQRHVSYTGLHDTTQSPS